MASNTRHELSAVIKRLVRNTTFITAEATEVRNKLTQFAREYNLPPEEPNLVAALAELTDELIAQRTSAWNNAAEKISTVMKSTSEFILESELFELWMNAIETGSIVIRRKGPGFNDSTLFVGEDSRGTVNTDYIRRLFQIAPALDEELIRVCVNPHQIILGWSEDRYVDESKFRALSMRAAHYGFRPLIIEGLAFESAAHPSSGTMLFLASDEDVGEDESDEESAMHLIPVGYLTLKTVKNILNDDWMTVSSVLGEAHYLEEDFEDEFDDDEGPDDEENDDA